jgi:phosphate-selective porin OprO/OprP
MRSAWVPPLFAVLLTAGLAGRGPTAEPPPGEASSAAKVLELEFRGPAPVETPAAGKGAGAEQSSGKSSDNASDPAAPPKTPLTYDLPGGVKFTPLGRLEADAVGVTQSPLNKATVGDLLNTTGFRRARIGARLQLADNVEWMSEFDFSNSQFRITNVYLGLNHLPVFGEIRVGQFREPFSLEAQTSSNYITFMERGEENSLVPGREWGVAIFAPAPDRQGLLAIGAFRSGSNTAGTDSSDQNDIAYTVRGTRLFCYNDAEDRFRLVHVGGAYSFRTPPGDSVTFSFQKGILEVGDSPLDPMLVSPVIPADQEHVFGVELAVVRGPLSLQGEWIATYVHQIGGGPVFYHGGYLYASWFLTGEHRGYDLKKGAFDEIHVHRPFGVSGDWRHRSIHGIGAFEFAVRYSYLDLDDPNAPPTAAGTRPGGTVGQLTCGLNWYLNDRTRLMANFSPTTLFNPNTGTSSGESFGIRFAAFW